MAHLDNSNKRLIQGVVRLLRENVSGWSTNSEHSVDNVWGKSVPASVQDEYPRGSVDIIAGNDFELSVELDVRLREVTVKVVAFGEVADNIEDLIDDSEQAIDNNWDGTDSNGNPYVGDWHLREFDGFTPLNETGESEGDLRYNRSVDVIFEVVRD